MDANTLYFEVSYTGVLVHELHAQVEKKKWTLH